MVRTQHTKEDTIDTVDMEHIVRRSKIAMY